MRLSTFAVILFTLIGALLTAPLAAPQTPAQLAKLTTSSALSWDNVGQSVAVEGSLVLVGVPYAAVGSNIEQGEVSVYLKPSTGWHDMTQVFTLQASDGVARQQFGFAVAISGDTFAVSATSWSAGCTTTGGAVYVFLRSKGGPQQVAKLMPSDGYACDGFGYSVAISGDTIVVGSPVATQSGQAYVFVKPATGWSNMTETAKLTSSDSNAGWFGVTVSVSGNTVAIGSYMQNFTGEAYVFVEPATGWASMTETARLSPSDGVVGDSFGYAIAISGNTILVGSPNNPYGHYYGAGYIYVMPPSGWVSGTQTAKLTASDRVVFDLLGSSVFLNGSTALLGAPGPSYPALPTPGAAYIYSKPTTGWKTTSKFREKLIPADGLPTDNFGTAVSLSGSTVVVGAPYVHWDPDFNNPGPGAAYVFGR
jgi:hypothetical protein